jgi:hypothetical protein
VSKRAAQDLTSVELVTVLAMKYQQVEGCACYICIGGRFGGMKDCLPSEGKLVILTVLPKEGLELSACAHIILSTVFWEENK